MISIPGKGLNRIRLRTKANIPVGIGSGSTKPHRERQVEKEAFSELADNGSNWHCSSELLRGELAKIGAELPAKAVGQQTSTESDPHHLHTTTKY